MVRIGEHWVRYRTEVGEEVSKWETALGFELRNDAESRKDFEIVCTFKHPFQIGSLGSKSKIVQDDYKSARFTRSMSHPLDCRI